EHHGPAALGVEHVLQRRQELDAHVEGLLRARLVLGVERERLAWVDVFQAEAVVRHAEGLGQLAGRLGQVLHGSLVHAFTPSVRPSPRPLSRARLDGVLPRERDRWLTEARGVTGLDANAVRAALFRPRRSLTTRGFDAIIVEPVKSRRLEWRDLHGRGRP